MMLNKVISRSQTIFEFGFGEKLLRDQRLRLPIFSLAKVLIDSIQ